MGFLFWGNDKKKKDVPKLKLADCKPVDPKKLDKFAIILCGGGAAGRWQAGALTALAQLGVLENAKFMAGTSVGGLNTGLYAKYGGLIPDEEIKEGNDDIPPPPPGSEPIVDGGVKPSDGVIPEPFTGAVDIWENITKNKDAYNGSMGGLFDNIGIGAGFLFGRSAILDASPLRNLLKKIFGEETIGQLYEHWKTHVIITSLDLNAQKEEFYCSFGQNKDMKVYDALARTSAIPGVFSSVKGVDIDKDGNKTTHWHVDGGVGANNPFIAINKYNEAFPNDPVKKAIIIFCYPDEMVDTGTEFAKPDDKAEYKSFKSVLLRTVSSAMNAQEQMAEMIVEDKVKNYGFEILALWPSKDPGSPLEFDHLELLQEGYDFVVAGKGWSYKDNSMINISDFLKK